MKKVVDAEFVLQGTEAEIKRIENEIAEISKYKEVKTFSLTGKNLTVRIY